jgi:hypothetical protein
MMTLLPGAPPSLKVGVLSSVTPPLLIKPCSLPTLSVTPSTVGV